MVIFALTFVLFLVVYLRVASNLFSWFLIGVVRLLIIFCEIVKSNCFSKKGMDTNQNKQLFI